MSVNVSFSYATGKNRNQGILWITTRNKRLATGFIYLHKGKRKSFFQELTSKEDGSMPGPSLRMRDADSFLRRFWLNY